MIDSSRTSTTEFPQHLNLIKDNCARYNYHLGPFIPSQNEYLKTLSRIKCRRQGPLTLRLRQYCPRDDPVDAAPVVPCPNFLRAEDKKFSSECFPRCEYRTRFNGTSAFQMSETEYWRTYFRTTSCCSDSDRLSKLELKDYENPYTNEPKTTPVLTGTFCSPWQHAQYKEIFYETPCAPQVTYKPAHLYDMLLSYKKVNCLKVEKLFNEQQVDDNKLQVYCENEYPCIMVKIEDFNNILQETTSLYEIAIAYFVALTNKIAHLENIPIEVVNRSSFGHNVPSVSEMITSFRINIGIVPEIYTGVIVKSLIELNNRFLVPLLNATYKLELSQTQIKKHNDGVATYNDHNLAKQKSQSVSTWSENEGLVKVLTKVGHYGGAKVSKLIMRQKKFVDLLTNYINEELDQFQPNLAKPLNELLGALLYSDIAILNLNEDAYKTNSLHEFRREENVNIKADVVFWRIMRDISFCLDVNGTHEMSESLDARKILGLYSQLEKANLEFIRNSGHQDAEDGCGSDSDCEVHSTPALYSKKVIVATGMRAINLAQYLSLYHLRQKGFNPQYEAEKMYFETKEAVKAVSDIFALSCSHTNQERNLGDATIRYLDLNYCAACGPESVKLEDILERLSENDVVVLDYTSTETEKINDSVKLLSTKVQLVILVSSGLKNEQLGADMNPYGTIRIVAKDRAVLNRLYYVLKNALEVGEEVLPKQLHRIRKAYKNAGAVVTNEAIYKQMYRKMNSNVHFDKGSTAKATL